MSVACLLCSDKPLHFFVPSYQRGYRWGVQQVTYLFRDIEEFVDNAKKDDFYCLQPIVVQQHTWRAANDEVRSGFAVIDGQQRLTTLRLLLSLIQGEDHNHLKLFTIDYESRPELDFDKLDSYPANIDSFHLHQAKKRLETLWTEYKNRGKKLSPIREALFNEENPSVKIIWYNLTEQHKVGFEKDKQQAIELFNTMNGRNIPLTTSENIKALFILGLKKGDQSFTAEDLALRWDELEQRLQEPQLWSFISPLDKPANQRIEDFLRCAFPHEEEPKSLDLFHRYELLFRGEQPARAFTEKWEAIAQLKELVLYCYHNTELYNLVGLLAAFEGKSVLQTLQSTLANCPRNISDQREKLKTAIENKLKFPKGKEIKDLTYKDKEIRNILLLHNVLYTMQHFEQRFRFDLYHKGKYDIEHILPQTEHKLDTVEQWTEWLKSFIATAPDLKKALAAEASDQAEKTAENYSSRETDLIEEAKALLDGSKKLDSNTFNAFYGEVISRTQPKDFDEHQLGNLALLPASINRCYGNALFMVKRQTILNHEVRKTKDNNKEREYIPPDTRDAFLKRFSTKIAPDKLGQDNWAEEDANDYVEHICQTIKEFLPNSRTP